MKRVALLIAITVSPCKPDVAAHPLSGPRIDAASVRGQPSPPHALRDAG